MVNSSDVREAKENPLIVDNLCKQETAAVWPIVGICVIAGIFIIIIGTTGGIFIQMLLIATVFGWGYTVG